MVELTAALREVGASDALGVILAANGPVFSAGHNFADMKGALEMAFTGDPIDARTAADWGLVNRVVPADQLDEATHELISRATRGSARSKALGKHAFYAQVDLPQDKAYAYAVEMMAAAAL